MGDKPTVFSMTEFYEILESLKEDVEKGAYGPGRFDPKINEETDPELTHLFRTYSLDSSNVTHWQLLARALSNFVRVGTGGRAVDWTAERKKSLVEKAYKIKKGDPYGIS